MSTSRLTLLWLNALLSFSATAFDNKAIFAELDKDCNGMLSEGGTYKCLAL